MSSPIAARLGYTANVGPGTVSVLDLAGRKTVAIIPVSPKVQRISITNDDKFVFTSDQSKPQPGRHRYRHQQGEVLGSSSWNRPTAAPPHPTAVSSSLPSLPPARSPSSISASLKVARTIDVPKTPQEILIRPDGKVAYVSCNTTGQVAAIDLSQGTVGKLIPTGKLADGLAWAR